MIEHPALPTPLASPRPVTPDARARGMVSTLALGLFGGAVLGAVARAWMRLIADDPEFSWGGTMFIVIGFTIFGFTQALVAIVRRRTRRRWSISVARAIGTFGLLPLFVGAGGLMLPTVVGGGFAASRSDWRTRYRALCLVVAAAPIVLVTRDVIDDFGVSMHTLSGVALLLGIYATIVGVARSTFAANPRGLRIPRWIRVGAFVLLGLLLVHFTVGVSTS